VKRELPPALLGAIAVVTLLVIGGLGFFWFNGQVNPGEDLELAKKQADFERSRTPRGAGAADGQAPASNYSPGRESEMEAREKSGK
jgi:hypothetical protein